ncbi:N-acetylneuraminate synthase family protein [Treponema sp. R80B11-R83G3]
MNENEKNLLIIGESVYCSKNPLIIAELGTSHNGDIKKAKLLIDAASVSGAGCIKVQMVYADEILHKNTGEVPLPGGKIRLYDQFKSLEAPVEFYAEIKEYAESKGLLFLCTPFGLKSAKILKEMQPKIVKIASPELNFIGLLEEIAGWGLPILLSSGVSRLSDIENAVEAFGELRKKTSICLLHCVTSYPAPETDYNLKVLPNLSAIFGVSVGVSDHSSDPELVPALAVAMGAVVIEKHFCLSKTDGGLDDPIAQPPEEFSRMARAIRRAAEAGVKETIAYYSRERGEDFISQILGSGVKELAPSEKANYRLTNRSIHALRDIAAGEILKEGDYACLRTEKLLRPGLEPCWEKAIKGRTVRNFIPSGEGIRFEDI